MQGKIAGVPARVWLAGTANGNASSSPRRTPVSSPIAWAGVASVSDHTDRSRRSAGPTTPSSLRRRDRWGRRARARHRVLPGDPARHHERCRPRGRLHRLGQHRTEHDDHPRQLRGPRGDPFYHHSLSCTGPRSRNRRGDLPSDQGHRLDRPYRDGDADRACSGRDEQGLWRGRPSAQPGRGQGTRPADRPDRRWPLSGPWRIASRRGRTARHDRVAWAYASGASHVASTSSSTAGDRPDAPRRAGRGRPDRRRPDPGRHGPVGRRWPGHGHAAHGRRPPADPDPSAPRLRDQRLRAGLLDRSSPPPSSPAMSRRPNADRC